MLIVDTSVLLAAADNADPDHHTSVTAIEGESPLVTTPLVIAETTYLIGRQLGAVPRRRSLCRGRRRGPGRGDHAG